ncbi:MAG: DUF58 domain-containing protein [Actinomycetota bacterium]
MSGRPGGAVVADRPATAHHRYSLTPTGAGVLTLVVPGLLAAMAAQQRPLVAMSLGAAMVLLVDAVSARRSVARPEVSASGPKTAIVGFEYRLRLDWRTDRALECLVGVEGATRPWVPALLPATGDVVVTSNERGVVEEVVVRLQTSVPFGLVACARTMRVPLVAPVHIEPRRVPVRLPPPAVIDPMNHAYRGDDSVGLRPYAIGDAPRDVHWPSVARTGTMVVRDRRRTAAGTELDVIIDTADAEDDLAHMLGQAGSALEQLLAAGYHIRLVTIEAEPAPSEPAVDRGAGAEGRGERPVRYAIGLLTARDEIGVRLSRIVVGRPGRLEGLIGSSARLVIEPGGFRWLSSR